MKLMYHKTELYCKWFHEDECEPIQDEIDCINEFTEKVPPYANYVWNQELNEWELPEIID